MCLGSYRHYISELREQYWDMRSTRQGNNIKEPEIRGVAQLFSQPQQLLLFKYL